MDEAVARGADHVGGKGVMETTAAGNFQFRNTRIDDAGNEVSDIARFDVNPSTEHVQMEGAHLNLETHVRSGNELKRTNDHIAIDPTTVRPGDFPDIPQ